jgi:deoxyribonucleoside regulator
MGTTVGDRGDTRRDLIVEAARLYYIEELSQAEVGKRLNMVRSNVSKILKQARAKGYVEIRIVEPSTASLLLEFKLKERFDLREVDVVASEKTYDRTLISVGKQAARFVESELKDGVRIAVSWGTSLFQMVEHVQNLSIPHSSVVQLHGGIGANNLEIDGWELARRFARKIDASIHIVHAPLVVRSEELRDLLILDQNVAESLELAVHADAAFLGIGVPDPKYSALVRAGYISEAESNELNRIGSVGMICGYFYDIEGKLVESQVNRQIVSLNLDLVKKIPLRVAVAAGDRKVKALLGAIQGGYVNALVIDEEAAVGLLESTE